MNLDESGLPETVGVELEWLASLPLWEQIGHPPFPMDQNWCRKPCRPGRGIEVGLHRLRSQKPLIFVELKNVEKRFCSTPLVSTESPHPKLLGLIGERMSRDEDQQDGVDCFEAPNLTAPKIHC